jgi:DNA-binding beta-propeller fold protein YncE
VYVTDTFNHTIRRITSAGVVTTIAGLAGTSGTLDGTGTTARFNFPRGIAIDSGGAFLYVSDTSNHTIRKISISGGTVTTLAGTAGIAGHVNGIGTGASFDMPTGLTVDSSANIYVADKNNQLIRMINSSGAVTTFAGHAGINGNTDTAGGAGCTGVPKSYMFQHGNGEVMDLLYSVSGAVYHQRAATSVDVNSADSSIALSPFYGVITDPAFANLPVISAGAHALYFYIGITMLGSPLNANSGNYIYYNGSAWTKFTETDSVKLLLQP